MKKNEGPAITQEVSLKRFTQVTIEGGMDSVTKSLIPIAGGLEPETLPTSYSRLPDSRKVFSDSLLAELGQLLTEQYAIKGSDSKLR